MSSRPSEGAAEDVHTLYRVGVMGTSTDGQLVAHLVSDPEGGQAALRVLLDRHGPMVLGVCHRVLGDAHAAEDAFQATFLVLVRKAGTLQDRDLLANWLYGVALRVASKAKAKAARRRAVERQAAREASGPEGDPDRAELCSVIDEEIRRLPERYRVPLVLCYMEGLRHHEVAQRLGCPVGTVESRLSRAREQLRARLVRRGLVPTSAVIVATLAPPSGSAAPPLLASAALRAAAGLPAGRAGSGLASVLGSVVSATRLTPWLPRVAAVTALAAGAGVLALGFTSGPGGSAPARRPGTTPLKHGPGVTTPAQDATPPPRVDRREAPLPPSVPRGLSNPDSPARLKHVSAAVAVPLAGIAIDGRLDDWPDGLTRYPIDVPLAGHEKFTPAPGETRATKGWSLFGGLGGRPSPPTDRAAREPDAYFMVGYDRKAGLIDLAVVVPDKDLVVKAGDPWNTDAVEVFIDGSFSDRRLPAPAGDQETGLDASQMPALQYVAVPGAVAAYTDRSGANPSLAYGQIRRTATKMAYRREGNVTIYEWAVQPFDRYPDQPTRLEPGKNIGLDVVVIDRDRVAPLPFWYCWARPCVYFKAFDAATLGKLTLADPSHPSPPPPPSSTTRTP